MEFRGKEPGPPLFLELKWSRGLGGMVDKEVEAGWIQWIRGQPGLQSWETLSQEIKKEKKKEEKRLLNFTLKLGQKI